MGSRIVFDPEFFVFIDLHDAPVVHHYFDRSEAYVLQDRDDVLGYILALG